jgi:thiol-disulfide isomerase/thioredoxin
MSRSGRSPYAWLVVGLAAGAVALALLAAILALRQDSIRAPRSVEPPAEAARAGELELLDVNPRSATHGLKVRLSEVAAAGGAVVNFMASWCPPCIVELPDLEAIHEAGTAPVVCVAANEEDGTADLLDLVERTGITLPVLYAEGGDVDVLDAHFPHLVFPTTYLLGPDGSILRMLPGLQSREALDQAIREHLGS